jgi:hypothetical protein
MYILRMAAVYSQGYRAVGVLDRGCECEHHHRPTKRDSRAHAAQQTEREKRRKEEEEEEGDSASVWKRLNSINFNSYLRLAIGAIHTEFRWSQDKRFQKNSKKAVENLKLEAPPP